MFLCCYLCHPVAVMPRHSRPKDGVASLAWRGIQSIRFVDATGSPAFAGDDN
jgi:hypothetical protein